MKICTELGKPSAAPNPVPEKRIDKHGYEKTIYNKGFKTPSFCHGTCGNGSCCIHEYHLEKEQCKNAYVIYITIQEISNSPPNAKVVAEQMYDILMGDNALASSQRTCI